MKNKMQMLSLDIVTVSIDEYVIVDDLKLTDCCFVKLFIDGEDVNKLFLDNEPLIVFDELLKSAKDSGAYLIFTSVIGIADDGGWDMVRVVHSSLTVTWDLEYNHDQFYRFVFDKKQYIDEIYRVLVELKKSQYILEPVAIVYPEEWDDVM